MNVFSCIKLNTTQHAQEINESFLKWIQNVKKLMENSKYERRETKTAEQRKMLKPILFDAHETIYEMNLRREGVVENYTRV